MHNLHYEIMSPDHLQNVLPWLKQTELQVKLMHLQRSSEYPNTDSKDKLSERGKAQKDAYGGSKITENLQSQNMIPLFSQPNSS